MLSVVSVCHSVHSPWEICHDALGLTIQGPRLPLDMATHCIGPCASDIWWPILETYSTVFTWGPPPPRPSHLTPDGQDWRPDQTSDGQDWRPDQICSLEDPLPHPTSCGYGSIYGWQAGGTHPTSMRPCFIQTCNSYSFSFFFSRSVT